MTDIRDNPTLNRAGHLGHTEDERLLDTERVEGPAHIDFTRSDPWRVFRIMGEFVEGFDTLANIGPAVSIFGSARVRPDDPQYHAAREMAGLLAEAGFAVITGGGPGIMEAANRGAFDAGAKTAGLNITLPQEQMPNPYITPGLCFQFHYFALRKMHFLMRAKALVVFPGGFGTLDELFDALTLRQTGRMQALPILLYGRDYWRRVIDFDFLADEGVVADRDLEMFQYVESPQEAWDVISRYHEQPPMEF
jgi:uncharacterized protein (TIGR00730 family)